jgi:hypothetical protein
MPTDQTIHEEQLVTTAAANDEIVIWRTLNNDTKRITRLNFIGATFTGGGTIASGGFDLSLEANSVVKGNLRGNISGDGTLAFAAAGLTLNVAASGTVALTDVAQTISAAKTFSGATTFSGIVTHTAAQMNLPSQFIYSMTAITLNNNTALVLNIGTTGVVLIYNTQVTNQCAIINFRAASGPYANIVAQPGSVFETATFGLTGTTGNAGKITFSASSNTNTYIENQTGATLTGLRILRLL